MCDTLSLFDGPHIPRIRFARAIDELDFPSALRDAPAELRTPVTQLASILPDPHRVAQVDLNRLRTLPRRGWPSSLEQAWQKLVGRRLDAHGIPGVLDGEPAGAFLLRGGATEQAHRSLRRHLDRHPRDTRTWAVLAAIEPVRAAARCGFHGGPIIEAGVTALLDMIEEDEIGEAAPWLLNYAWLAGELGFDEIEHALEAEGLLHDPPLTIADDARAFAWYLLDARGRRLSRHSVGVVAARRRLQEISATAFQRYLGRL